MLIGLPIAILYFLGKVLRRHASID